MGWAFLILGLILALTAAVLLLAGVIESGIAALVGIVGIGLIAAAGRRLRPETERVVQTIFSPDRKLRALVKLGRDGKYHIEVQKHFHEYSPDVGSHDRWERLSDMPASGSLSQIFEAAADRVGAGKVDFFEPKA